MKNDLFHFLTSRKIFKDNYSSDIDGNILNFASEKTEQRRRERRRGILVWLSLGFRKNVITKNTEKFGRGTYIRNLHGKLK